MVLITVVVGIKHSDKFHNENDNDIDDGKEGTGADYKFENDW